MADTIKGKLTEAGNAISETASKVGNRIAEKAEVVKDWGKQKLNKVDNRIDEAAEKAKNADEEARVDEQEKAKDCGQCS